MPKPGYQAVALEAASAAKLRQLARYLSVTRNQRVTLSDALEHVISAWFAEHVHPGPLATESLAAFLERARAADAPAGRQP